MSKKIDTDELIIGIENIKNNIEATIDLMYLYEKNNQIDNYKNVISILGNLNLFAEDLFEKIKNGVEDE